MKPQVRAHIRGSRVGGQGRGRTADLPIFSRRPFRWLHRCDLRRCAFRRSEAALVGAVWARMAVAGRCWLDGPDRGWAARDSWCGTVQTVQCVHQCWSAP